MVKAYSDAFTLSETLADEEALRNPGTARYRGFPIFNSRKIGPSWGDSLKSAEHNLGVINRAALNEDNKEAYDRASKLILGMKPTTRALFSIPSKFLQEVGDYRHEPLIEYFTRDVLDTLTGTMSLKDLVLEGEDLLEFGSSILTAGVPDNRREAFARVVLPYVGGTYEAAVEEFTTDVELFENAIQELWSLALIEEALS